MNCKRKLGCIENRIRNALKKYDFLHFPYHQFCCVGVIAFWIKRKLFLKTGVHTEYIIIVKADFGILVLAQSQSSRRLCHLRAFQLPDLKHSL